MSLTLDEMNRYAQQLKLDSIGLEGQLKLKNARVLCVGAGGLGSSLLLYLAAAGIGTIGIVDDEVIELSNLHRQILYQHSHIGNKKAIIAKQQLSLLNPSIDIYAYSERINLNNISELISQYDIVADCSDNFVTRYLINDACFYQNKPYVFASISEFTGQCSLFLGKQSPCFRCLFPYKPIMSTVLDCNAGGVLGVLPGLFGVIQATEIIKWILKLGDTLAGYLLVVDILKMQFRKFHLTQSPECLCCVLQQPLAVVTQSETCSNGHAISAKELCKKLEAQENILLLDVRTLKEHQTFNLGGILIPLAELSCRLVELDADQPIIVYCQSGKRSIQAVNVLMEANFNQVSYLQGGISAWQAL
jgi:adenylyltransferase/sulfurtransferase